MDLRIFPKKRQIPEKKPPTFILFPFEYYEKVREPFESKVAEARELIKNHLLQFKKTYIVSSHGKDSIVMVHMVMDVWRELVAEGHKIRKPEVWLNHTLNTYKEEAEYWTKINKILDIEDVFKVFFPPKDKDGKQYTVWSIAKEEGYLPWFRRTGRKIKGRKAYKKANTPKCCDILKKATIKNHLKELPKDERYDCVFVGTRGEESSIRRLGVLQRCRTYFMKTRAAYPIQTVTPLSFLTTDTWKNHQGEWEDTWITKFRNGKIRTIPKLGPKKFIPYKGQDKPENDIEKYYAKYDIPINPTYEIHNIPRMGCASCPAHIGWEERLSKDPTSEGFGMLRQNLKILRESAKTDDEEKERFDQSLAALKKYLKSKKSKEEIDEKQRTRLIELIKEFDNNFITL